MKTTNGQDFKTLSKLHRRALRLNEVLTCTLLIVCIICILCGIAYKNFLMFWLSIAGIIATLLINVLVECFVEICENISDIKNQIQK